MLTSTGTDVASSQVGRHSFDGVVWVGLIRVSWGMLDSADSLHASLWGRAVYGKCDMWACYCMLLLCCAERRLERLDSVVCMRAVHAVLGSRVDDGWYVDPFMWFGGCALVRVCQLHTEQAGFDAPVWAAVRKS